MRRSAPQPWIMKTPTGGTMRCQLWITNGMENGKAVRKMVMMMRRTAEIMVTVV